MRVFWIVLLLVLLVGCHWSEPLLPEPNADIDTRLLGEWQAVGERFSSLSISSPDSRNYSVVLKRRSGRDQTEFHFWGYHTDIGDVRLISLKLIEAHYGPEKKTLPKVGRQQRWIPMGYVVGDDGQLSLRFISHYVTPRTSSPDEMLAISGKQLYQSFAGALVSPHHRERFFDTSTDVPKFRKQPVTISPP